MFVDSAADVECCFIPEYYPLPEIVVPKQFLHVRAEGRVSALSGSVIACTSCSL